MSFGPMDTVRIAVVGAGVMGLSTAVCISKMVPGCSITVISDKFTPETTSDVAAGMLIPPTYPDTPIQKQKQWFKETFDHLFAIVNSTEAEDAGVILVSGWQIFRSIPTEEVPYWADVVLGFRKMTKDELKKFPQHVFGHAFTTLKCEGPAYLPWLQKRVSWQAGDPGEPMPYGSSLKAGKHWTQEKPMFQPESEDRKKLTFQPECSPAEGRVKGSGGLILTRQIEDLWELHPSFDIVVNCSGLGSRQLAGDSEIFPVRGQVLKVQAPWVKHFIRDSSGLTYIYPGVSNVTLGGTRQKGDWNLSPDAEISKEILSRCCALEPSLRGAYDLREKVGLRPSRPGVRLEKELLAQGSRRLPVVHNYGHGSGGIAMHWGTALEATRLVNECVQVLRTPAPKSKL
ncbi:D-aspartate oxidase isoform X1 [Cervus elaphus]|uniref:D-aspartate oxidase isoform X1 n=1 Tax=Cervus canadensis TaxID=1574408 RepID=UPI001CA37DE4|nr:D-aspartate oxidase isoform X1 [Cervus canadensis]XP_043746301.1 D-aspartate oxidase isoform X1 [Cervus elaphus]